MAKRSPTELTPAQQRFVAEYVADIEHGNATQAYMRANPTVTYATARTNAARLLAKACIRRAVDKRRRAMDKRFGLTPERARRELARLAFSDLGDVMDLTNPKAPKLRKGDSLTPDARRAIQEVSVTPKGVKVKLHDKVGSLDKVLKHLGLYKELPPLEAVLALLPEGVRERLRHELAAALLPGADPGGAGGDVPGSDHGGGLPPGGARPDADVPAGGADAGPVAGSVPPRPVPAADAALLPPVGEDDGGGEPNPDALFGPP